MTQIDDKDDRTGRDMVARSSKPSRLKRVALAAAAESDGISIDRKWGPAWTLLLVIAAPAAVWALIALTLAHR